MWRKQNAMRKTTPQHHMELQPYQIVVQNHTTFRLFVYFALYPCVQLFWIEHPERYRFGRQRQHVHILQIALQSLVGGLTLGAPRSARRSRCLEKMPGRLQQKVQVLFFWRRTWIQCRLSKETETYLDYVDFDSVDEVRCSLGQVQMLDVNPVRRFQAFVSPMPPVPPPLAP